MLLRVKIKLESEFLGQDRHSDGIRRFRKSPDGKQWAVDGAQWSWAMSEAIEALGFHDLDATSIRIERLIKLPTIALHRRRWSGGRKGREEMFESFREGAVLTFKVFVANKPEREGAVLRSPTIGEFESIMAFIGEMVGLSPWGGKFGYGRFSVLSVEETNSLKDDAKISDVRRLSSDDSPIESSSGEVTDVRPQELGVESEDKEEGAEGYTC